MSSKAVKDFSDREMKIMGWAMQSMEGEPKVDYKKLAALAGMTNVGSASNAWAGIKKKLAAKADNTDNTTPTPSTPAKSGSRKRNKDTFEDQPDEEGADPTPSKKAKAKPSPGRVKGKGKAGLVVAKADSPVLDFDGGDALEDRKTLVKKEKNEFEDAEEYIE